MIRKANIININNSSPLNNINFKKNFWLNEPKIVLKDSPINMKWFIQENKAREPHSITNIFDFNNY
jgi:hypothetical protein